MGSSLALTVAVVLALIAGIVVGGAIASMLRKNADASLKAAADARLEAERQGLAASSAAARAEAESARTRAEAELATAKARAEGIVREAEIAARENAFKARQEFEDSTRTKTRELAELEKRVNALEAKAEQREQEIARRAAALEMKEKGVAETETKLAAALADSLASLERIAGLSAEAAKKEIVQRVEDDARHDAARRVQIVEEEAKEESEKRAKKIISVAIQRWAGDHVSDTATTTVRIPNDDMKGRIIGREGRNIRAIEAATGVDVIIDDTPEVITVSAFNPIRREVARIAIETLLADGRIHPGRIEECVRKAEELVEVEIKKAGEQAIFDTGLTNVHPEIVKLIGRLNYRYSYGQNQWKHALEVSFICGAMAAEMGLNEKMARRAGLLHDIGKTMVHDQEGSHALLGAAAARKFGEHPKIVHAIAAHHEEEKPETILASLTQAADALSGARPGARMEVMESYVKRLQDIEDIAMSFKGVEKTFAIQAGREVRVIVGSEQVTDSDTVMLARDIAKKIESDLTYPGQIKVTVIRETRSSEFAR